MAETRPKDYPKLKDYQPTRFMLPTSHYDKAKADRAVKFIENLRHTKAKWVIMVSRQIKLLISSLGCRYKIRYSGWSKALSFPFPPSV